ncbi:MAG: Rpn family recombination-promoting nuclease/putative transposase [Planctomycetes bacterium]|nr:Rpn family recombination-promoting nuclease/putative transposase [Planctomycetota bacterium]
MTAVLRVMAPTPHDLLFRSIFRLPRHAAAELGEVLPREFRERIDLATLTRVEGSFVDEALRASSSDLLFRARWKGITTVPRSDAEIVGGADVPAPRSARKPSRTDRCARCGAVPSLADVSRRRRRRASAPRRRPSVAPLRAARAADARGRGRRRATARATGRHRRPSCRSACRSSAARPRRSR